MATNLVLTVIGQDKPGLVESLAEVVAHNSGNWLESSMSQLAGKFAGILRVSVDDADAENLISALDGISDQLKIVIERVDGEIEVESSKMIELSLVGNDRPGIVREISHALSGLSVNVEELSTECEPAPMSSGDLFKAYAKLKTPSGLEPEVLQQELEAIADDLMVEINLS